MKIVVLTGAGVSAESGIKTFRAADGLWENHRVEDVATPQAFERDPDLVYRFYNQRRQQLLSDDIQPNAAHIALAEFANHSGHEVVLVTQNIDDLHERAGSKGVIHMHGELLKARCVATGQRIEVRGDFDGSHGCYCCRPKQAIRPDIVWFGEIPFHMDAIELALSDAELFISLGTSGNVYPAAGFVSVAKQFGAKTVEINLEPSVTNELFDEHHYGLATEVLPPYLSKLANL